MACSLASRISLYEAGAKDVQFVEVDPKTKRTMAGTNYFEIYPLGLKQFPAYLNRWDSQQARNEGVFAH
jgi:hypothetical protein